MGCRLIEVDLSTLEDQTRCAVCLGADFSSLPSSKDIATIMLHGHLRVIQLGWPLCVHIGSVAASIACTPPPDLLDHPMQHHAVHICMYGNKSLCAPMRVNIAISVGRHHQGLAPGVRLHAPLLHAVH